MCSCGGGWAGTGWRTLSELCRPGLLRGRGGTPLQRVTEFLGVQAVPKRMDSSGWFPRLTQTGGTVTLVSCSPGHHPHPAQGKLFCCLRDDRADLGCPLPSEHRVQGVFGVDSGTISHSWVFRWLRTLGGWPGLALPSPNPRVCRACGEMGRPFSPGMNDKHLPHSFPVPPRSPAPPRGRQLPLTVTPAPPLPGPLGRSPHTPESEVS